MPLLSIEFILFFMAFFVLYWLIRPWPKGQNILLLGVSLGWLYYLNPLYFGSVVVYAVVVAAMAYLMQRYRQSKWLLIIGIIFCLCGLCIFKYADFYRQHLPAAWQSPFMDLLLPLGISYYTFQSISYLVELYRERVTTLSFLQILLHLSFFPTITAGPIFRATSFKTIRGETEGAVSQIRTLTRRSIIQPALAITLILLGIAKKWWLAGQFGEHCVDPIFANPLQYDPFTVLTAIFAYTTQLFFDFSGYTDLVIGISMLLGYQLPENFVAPLLATNIRDFWNRWHITLSTWIRDYIYIPLGGSRDGFLRTQLNLLIAMTLSGIWHGYGWNFFIWGLLHGMALVALNISDKYFGGRNLLSQKDWWGKGVSIATTLTFVAFAFVIFHTNTLEDAMLIFRALWQPLSLPTLSTAIAATMMLFMLVYHRHIGRLINGFTVFLQHLPYWLWPLPIAVILFIIITLAPSGIPGFIYANF